MKSSLLPISIGLSLLIAVLRPSATPSTADLPPPGYRLLAWNDLGMHCMDSNYDVFSILPPFNVVQAQLIDPNGDLVTNPAGFTVTYEAVADPEGSINTSSVGKTDYWQRANQLYGAGTVPDTGLLGADMPGPGNAPKTMAFDAGRSLFEGRGVPITPYDDQGRKRYYPLMQVSARNSQGTLLASARVVLPVSDEMDCRLCHGSGAATQAQPLAGWVHDADNERDFRLNILRLHDEKQAGNAGYAAALASAGFLATGLYDTVVQADQPILCAKCHASNALPGTGIAGITQLTTAIHAGHAAVLDPVNGLSLDASANRAACYRCHPGSDTRCLRGAMGAAVAADGSLAMQCQSCHGSMSAVGGAQRVGWLDQPACQNCHTGDAVSNNGQIRYSSALEANGSRRLAVNPRFATEAAAPAPGFDLYRFSAGHGGLTCETCHGSTHAEYPGAHGNDNLQSQDLQGHAGTIIECNACHVGQPETVTGGPHGMHPVGSQWVNDHGDPAENNAAQCKVCHGTDYRGTVLSVAHATRSFSTSLGTQTFFKGEKVGCWRCHVGPTSDNVNNNPKPVANGGMIAVLDLPVSIGLVANDPNGNPLTYRIVEQPRGGRVALAGTVATYHPDPGFAGIDSFSFAVNDGDRDSNVAQISVQRGANSSVFGAGYPGTMGLIPTLGLSARPVLGTTPNLLLDNVRGVGTPAIFVASVELLPRPTGAGGLLLVRPDILAVQILPAPTGSFPVSLPNVPTLEGMRVAVQAAEYDPGATFGWAFTPALLMTLGY